MLGALIEKVPFVALAGIASAATYLVQQRGDPAGQAQGFEIKLRLANAVVSWVRYLGKTFWPSDLTVLYLHPNVGGGTPWTAWQIVGSIVLLTVITIATIVARRRYLIVGWLWFVGTLVPVIGLIQVGNQAMADRYTYLPSIGIFIMIAWTGAQGVTRRPRRAKRADMIGGAVAVLIVAASIFCSFVQAKHWRNSTSLFSHALAVEPHNPIMLTRMGRVMQTGGAREQAVDYYHRALAINADMPDAHIYLALEYIRQQRYDDATGHLDRAGQLAPKSAQVHQIMGYVLQQTGRQEEAIESFEQAIMLDDTMYQAYNSLDDTYQALRRYDDAAEQYQRALQIKADFVPSHLGLAIVYELQDRLDDAIAHLQQVVQLRPRHVNAHFVLGMHLQTQGRLDRAIRHYELAVQYDPNHSAARRHLEAALQARRQP